MGYGSDYRRHGPGKLAFARRELGVTAWSDAALGDENCVYGLQRIVRDMPDARNAVLAWRTAHPDGVIICDEVGCGVTPLDRADRDWREAVGRLCCELADSAEAVYRVSCGIGRRIK